MVIVGRAGTTWRGECARDEDGNEDLVPGHGSSEHLTATSCCVTTSSFRSIVAFVSRSGPRSRPARERCRCRVVGLLCVEEKQPTRSFPIRLTRDGFGRWRY